MAPDLGPLAARMIPHFLEKWASEVALAAGIAGGLVKTYPAASRQDRLPFDDQTVPPTRLSFVGGTGIAIALMVAHGTRRSRVRKAAAHRFCPDPDHGQHDTLARR